MENVVAIDREFTSAFDQELLKSEKQRVTILGFLFIMVMVAFIITAGTNFYNFNIEKRQYLYIPIVIFTFAIAYQFTLRAIFEYRIRQKKNIIEAARYINVFIDMTIPTAMTFTFMVITDNLQGLSSPPSYMYFAFILLSVLRLDFKLAFFSGLVAAIQYSCLLFYAWQATPELFNHGVSTTIFFISARSVIFLGIGTVAGLVSKEVKERTENALRIVSERNAIIETFGKHVSPEVVDQLMHQESEIESREVAVMFLDIRNFTSFSENRNPVEIIGLLNEAFAFMIEIINKNHGIINKFLGDGFMAVFGAPISKDNNCLNAIQAALEIIDTLDARKSGFEEDHFRVGIGIHYGEAVTGILRSSTRKEYTIIGDVVNLASRIEQLNKKFESELLVSDAVAISAGYDLDRAEKMQMVTVKGRQEPVQTYKLR